MRMPRLNEIPKSRKTIDTFGGYNHSNSVAEYEFYDTTNMSTREYPSLAPRKPRGTPMDPDYEPGSSPTDGKFHSPRALTRVDDNVAFLQYDRTEPAWYVRTLDQVYGPISDEHGLSSVDRIITNGAYIVGWQNGHSDTLRYVNTADSTDRGAVNAEWVQGANDDIDIDPCDAEGNVISVTTMATAPANPSNGDYWIDSSVSGNERTLQRYSVSQQSWVIVPAIYIKLSCPDIAENFSAGDVVQITNKDRLEGYPASIIRGYHLIEKAYHNENNTAQDYIVIIGQAATGGTTWPAPGAPGTEVYLYRTAPNMDYIIENGNRLWGCRYGENLKGEFVNEIYASALGDFKNWQNYVGISMDSYAASVGADGAFTGAITYNNNPIFFKENYMLKVYGTGPSNYQIQTSSVRGVQKGSWKSLAIVDDVLYYKSPGGICVYDGSVPTEITSVFGDKKYHSAVGCGHLGKYYVSMKDEDETPHLFVYDAKKRIWMHEENIEVKDFCSVGNTLYYIDGNDVLRTIEGDDNETVEWMIETGDIGLSSTFDYSTPMPDQKYISRLLLRMAMSQGSRADIYVRYDSLGDWEHVSAVTGNRLKPYHIAIRPHRCDHMRIKITGKGDVRIQSITKTYEQGSDIY